MFEKHLVQFKHLFHHISMGINSSARNYTVWDKKNKKNDVLQVVVCFKRSVGRGGAKR